MVKTETGFDPKCDYPKLMQHETGCVILATGPSTGMCVHATDITAVGTYSDAWGFDGADWEDFVGYVTITCEE